MEICMDSSDWLKTIVQEESGFMDSTSSPSTDLISYTRPPPVQPDRRLRPQPDPALKCPRCDSTHTKFCYYNNYSLSQPRYFCKTCRRYWTKGGSLRNVPVGGGCRKNKRPSSKKPTHVHPHPLTCGGGFHDETDLHLSFSGHEYYSSSLHDTQTGIEFMLGGSRGHAFNEMGFQLGGFHGMNQMGFSMDGGHGAVSFEGQEESIGMEVKPLERMLALEWQEQGCGEVGRDSFGYSNGLGSWAGNLINGHGLASS